MTEPEVQPLAAITFLTTPSATSTQVADAQSSWDALADTTDQNFALINAWINNGRAWPIAWRSTLAAPFNPPTQADYTEFGSAAWPALTVPIPAGCRGLWLILSTQLDTNPAKVNWLAVSATMSGTGFTTILPPEWLEVSATGKLLGISRWLSFPASSVVPGQSCVITPVYRQTGTATPINARVTKGDLYAVALV